MLSKLLHEEGRSFVQIKFYSEYGAKKGLCYFNIKAKWWAQNNMGWG